MNLLKSSILIGVLLLTGSAYLAWALLTEQGYDAGGEALKARYGLVYMPQAERQSLRKLAMMKAASQCEWELNEVFWNRVYELYVGEEHSMRAAVFAVLLAEQDRYFLTDLDHRRCDAAWARFGVGGADVPGILQVAADAAGAAATSKTILATDAQHGTPR